MAADRITVRWRVDAHGPSPGDYVPSRLFDSEAEAAAYAALKNPEWRFELIEIRTTEKRRRSLPALTVIHGRGR